MEKRKLQKHDKKPDSPLSTEYTETPPTHAQDLIESDPVSPAQPPSDTEQQRGERPDLDWAEHED